MIIIRDLLVGTTRFNDLARGLPGLSRTLLSKRLRQLEQAELVERIDGQYYLTEMGRDLEPVVFGLGAWGAKWALGHAGLDVDAETAKTVARIGPHGAVEIVLWILVSLSAGFCEEFVFRGYLMRQFAAWFGSWPAGLAASALVFGLGHAYQGLGPTLTIVVHGISFGLVALLTRGLVPGMTAHAVEDIVAGLS